MKMRVYVASHCRWAAAHVASVLLRHGQQIASRWHSKPFLATTAHTKTERAEIAQEDRDDVFAADALVLVSGPDKYSGGKFVEAGIAIGLQKTVIVIGRRENMLLWLPSVIAVDSPEAAAEVLTRQWRAIYAPVWCGPIYVRG